MGLHIDPNSSVHNSHAPFPAVCVWTGGLQAACCFHRQGSTWLACSLLLWRFLSLSQVLPSFRRENCSVMQKQNRKIFILIALKTQLLYERKAAWSPEPSFALLGVCEVRFCSRWALSGCICMFSGCPCLGHSWCKPRPPDVCALVMAQASGTSKLWLTGGGHFNQYSSSADLC